MSSAAKAVTGGTRPILQQASKHWPHTSPTLTVCDCIFFVGLSYMSFMTLRQVQKCESANTHTLYFEFRSLNFIF